MKRVRFADDVEGGDESDEETAGIGLDFANDPERPPPRPMGRAAAALMGSQVHHERPFDRPLIDEKTGFTFQFEDDFDVPGSRIFSEDGAGGIGRRRLLAQLAEEEDDDEDSPQVVELSEAEQEMAAGAAGESGNDIFRETHDISSRRFKLRGKQQQDSSSSSGPAEMQTDEEGTSVAAPPGPFSLDGTKAPIGFDSGPVDSARFASRVRDVFAALDAPGLKKTAKGSASDESSGEKEEGTFVLGGAKPKPVTEVRSAETAAAAATTRTDEEEKKSMSSTTTAASATTRPIFGKKCYTCGSTEHLVRNCPFSKQSAAGRTREEVPAYLRDPTKYTHYSMDDTPDLTDGSNQKAAFEFLRSLENASSAASSSSSTAASSASIGGGGTTTITFTAPGVRLAPEASVGRARRSRAAAAGATGVGETEAEAAAAPQQQPPPRERATKRKLDTLLGHLNGADEGDDAASATAPLTSSSSASSSDSTAAAAGDSSTTVVFRKSRAKKAARKVSTDLE